MEASFSVLQRSENILSYFCFCISVVSRTSQSLSAPIKIMAI